MANLYLVEGVSRWNIEDEKKPGTFITGSKIFLKFLEDKENQLDQADKKGSFPTTFNLPYNAFDHFAEHVPAIFEIEFDMKVGSKGQFTVKRAEFVEKYELVSQSDNQE